MAERTVYSVLGACSWVCPARVILTGLTGFPRRIFCDDGTTWVSPVVINGPGVAGAVLQTPLSWIILVTRPL